MGVRAGDPGHKFIDEGNHSAQAEATLDMQRPIRGYVCVYRSRSGTQGVTPNHTQLQFYM